MQKTCVTTGVFMKSHFVMKKRASRKSTFKNGIFAVRFSSMTACLFCLFSFCIPSVFAVTGYIENNDLKFFCNSETGTASVTGYSGSGGSVAIPSSVVLYWTTGGYEKEYHSAPCLVTSINFSAFSGNGSIAGISMPDSLTTITGSAFYNCNNLVAVSIGNGVTHIGSAAFSGCSSLTSITIPVGVTSIETGTFQNCSSLRDVTIQGNINSIGASAFYNCSSLSSVKVPGGVASLGMSVFENCRNLADVFFMGLPPTCSRSPFSNVAIGARGYYLAAHQKEWQAVIPTSGTNAGKWQGLIMEEWQGLGMEEEPMSNYEAWLALRELQDSSDNYSKWLVDPNNPNAKFLVKVEMRGASPFIWWEPDLGKNLRTYTVEGKTNLTDKAWHSPTNKMSRFFRVRVEE